MRVDQNTAGRYPCDFQWKQIVASVSGGQGRVAPGPLVGRGATSADGGVGGGRAVAGLG